MEAMTAGQTRAVTKHIVMWNVRGETQAEKETAAQLIKTSFEDLAGKIPGMRSVEVGLDMSGVDYACDVVLYMEFESPELLSAYATHPEHLRVKDVLGNSRIARHQVDFISTEPCHV
ncbi:MAG: Dabb family protein [Pseudomonadota bacterium]